jgi:hypothetical protein
MQWNDRERFLPPLVNTQILTTLAAIQFILGHQELASEITDNSKTYPSSFRFSSSLVLGGTIEFQTYAWNVKNALSLSGNGFLDENAFAGVYTSENRKSR